MSLSQLSRAFERSALAKHRSFSTAHTVSPLSRVYVQRNSRVRSMPRYGSKWSSGIYSASSWTNGASNRSFLRNMCTSSSAGSDADEKAREAAKRSEMLRQTLASLKSAPRPRVVQKTDVSEDLNTYASSQSLDHPNQNRLNSDEPRFWTTRPEPRPQAPSKGEMTWGEWIKSPQAIKASIKHEWEHYRDGSKLLYYNIVATTQIIRRKLRGQSLTRREYELLVRTASDLFRLVPFAVIIIIPFMEFALPFLLKLFPNMLPSTFASKLQQKEALKKQLNLKIEMARFLQDTLVEMKSEETDTATRNFIDKLKSGKGVSTEELVEYAKVFNEDVTLNNLQRNQLTALCRLLGLKPFGTDTLLIVQIRMKIASIQKDDRALMAEGVDTLTLEELQSAVLARGMYSQTKNKRVLRERLKSWLEMSVVKNVPITLLLLSRAFALNARADLAQTLRDTFNHMPQEVIDEIEVRVGGNMGRKVDRKLKLEALEQFRALIEEERASLMSGEAVDQNATPFAALATMTQPTELERLQIEELRAQVAAMKADIIDDAKALQQAMDDLTVTLDQEEKEEYEVLQQRRYALGHMTHDEIEAMEPLETDEQFKARWREKRKAELAVVMARQKEREAEKRRVRKLENRVVDMLAQLGVDVVEAKKQLEEELKVLDKNYDGLISEDELKYALSILDSKLTDEQIQLILDRLDANHDGLIEVEHLINVASDEFDIDLYSIVEAAKQQQIAEGNTASSSIPSSSSTSSSSSQHSSSDNRL